MCAIAPTKPTMNPKTPPANKLPTTDTSRYFQKMDQARPLTSRIVAMSSAPVGDGVHGGDDFVDVGQRKLFKVGRVGHRHVLAGNAGRRRVEVVEGLGDDAGGELGTDAVLRPALFHRDQPAGLLYALDHGRRVQRAQGAEVDELDVDAGGNQLFCSL